MINDEFGIRIAKRSKPELTIKNLRENGYSSLQVINLAKSMI